MVFPILTRAYLLFISRTLSSMAESFSPNTTSPSIGLHPASLARNSRVPIPTGPSSSNDFHRDEHSPSFLLSPLLDHSSHICSPSSPMQDFRLIPTFTQSSYDRVSGSIAAIILSTCPKDMLLVESFLAAVSFQGWPSLLTSHSGITGISPPCIHS